MRLLVSLAAALALAAPVAAQNGAAQPNPNDEARHRAVVAAQLRSQAKAHQAQLQNQAAQKAWQRAQAVKRQQLANQAGGSVRRANPDATNAQGNPGRQLAAPNHSNAGFRAAVRQRVQSRTADLQPQQRAAIWKAVQNRLESNRNANAHRAGNQGVRMVAARQVANQDAAARQAWVARRASQGVKASSANGPAAQARKAWVARQANQDANSGKPQQARKVSRASSAKPVVQRSSSVRRRPTAQSSKSRGVIKASKGFPARRAAPVRKSTPQRKAVKVGKVKARRR